MFPNWLTMGFLNSVKNPPAMQKITELSESLRSSCRTQISKFVEKHVTHSSIFLSDDPNWAHAISCESFTMSLLSLCSPKLPDLHSFGLSLASHNKYIWVLETQLQCSSPLPGNESEHGILCLPDANFSPYKFEFLLYYHVMTVTVFHRFAGNDLVLI